ncbi:MAG: hypothetical protein JO095_00425 [Alphaproteobacteria bacterium]|nr:hypothetical protein [Alphaproteobacteria bacterium]
MADPTRHPGSREEDAWLSDEQLEHCAPAETEPFQSPVPTRMVSNGEYMPYPQTRQQQHVEHRIKELAETASKKLGISRRQFLEGTGGLAASFIAINEAFGSPFSRSARSKCTSRQLTPSKERRQMCLSSMTRRTLSARAPTDPMG